MLFGVRSLGRSFGLVLWVVLSAHAFRGSCFWVCALGRAFGSCFSWFVLLSLCFGPCFQLVLRAFGFVLWAVLRALGGSFFLFVFLGFVLVFVRCF